MLLSPPTGSELDIPPGPASERPNPNSSRSVVSGFKTGKCGEHIALVSVRHYWRVQDLIDVHVDVVEIEVRVELLNWEANALALPAYETALLLEVTRAPRRPIQTPSR